MGLRSLLGDAVVGWAMNQIIISSKPNDGVFGVLNKAFNPMKEIKYTKEHGRVIVSEKCLILLQQWRLNIEIVPYVIKPFITVKARVGNHRVISHVWANYSYG